MSGLFNKIKKDGTCRRSRHDPRNPYTVISNVILRDKELSPGAKGTLCYMLSLPDDWCFVHEHLYGELRIGRKLLEKYLGEIMSAGYATRSRSKHKGRFSPYDYEITGLKNSLPKEILKKNGNLTYQMIRILTFYLP